MKNLFKPLGIIALVAVIGFTMISCSTNSTKSTDNDFITKQQLKDWSGGMKLAMTSQEINEWVKKYDLGLVQMGLATQEMKTSGLTAAHPSILIGSEARIKNVRNGKEVVVTITGRIAPSSTRIIDVSPETARALDFSYQKDPVLITGTRQTASAEVKQPETEQPLPRSQGARRPLVQRGMATQEMKTPGLTAAHPSIPKGSKVRITNIANSKEVVVTITDRIAPSATRVVDLSPDTALALDIGRGGPVMIAEIEEN